MAEYIITVPVGEGLKIIARFAPRPGTRPGVRAQARFQEVRKTNPKAEIWHQISGNLL